MARRVLSFLFLEHHQKLLYRFLRHLSIRFIPVRWRSVEPYGSFRPPRQYRTTPEPYPDRVTNGTLMFFQSHLSANGRVSLAEAERREIEEDYNDLTDSLSHKLLRVPRKRRLTWRKSRDAVLRSNW